MNKNIKNFAKKLKNILFPNNITCPLCGKDIFGEKRFCEDCDKMLPKNNGGICHNCGKKTAVDSEYCLGCKNKGYSFTKARSAFEYSYPADKLIRDFKFDNKRYLAEIFASYLKDEYLKSGFSCDLIIFTPMEKQEQKKRGYNQAELLAEALSEKIGLPLEKDLIFKVKSTERQVNLSGKKRSDNLIGAFKAGEKSKIEGKKILLVDDVLTTGSTADNISKKLMSKGAKEIYLFTIASVTPKLKEN